MTLPSETMVMNNPTRSLSLGGFLRRPETGSFIGLAAVFVFFTVFGGSNFASGTGAASWLNVAASLGIVAIPIGLLMIAGELDVSIGSMIPAGSMTVAIISGHFHAPILVGIVAALAVGALVGLVNGLLVIRTAVPSFIVTLGTLFAVAGLTLGLSVILTGTTSVAIKAGPEAKFLFGQFIGGAYQVTIVWWLVAVAFWAFVLHYSPYGNWILAMGGDKVSARNAGIPTDRMTVILFVCSGASAAFVGLSQAILYNSAQVSAGQSYIFNAIIAVVVGGVLLTGGYGSIIGIFLGTLTFAIVNQGIYYTGFDANWASLIIGILLLLAVLMNNTFRKLALSYTPAKGNAKQ
jgi:simple sugar transport system permease protein